LTGADGGTRIRAGSEMIGKQFAHYVGIGMQGVGPDGNTEIGGADVGYRRDERVAGVAFRRDDFSV